ncbi:uncharacterized protein [Rutidosis leptorrhynchoides]|uniref:uncharacterized protein n=1 Tax=Rutidosis leptorrhynchoides TaxID=125765 RepID=UPI003A98EFC2
MVKKITRISDDGTKFSKLDRFLVNDQFIKLWKDLSVVALERRESDHCPLVLRNRIIDFGPKPFKVFDEWLNKDDALRVVNEAWVKSVGGSRKDCVFRDKLKNVKRELKKWNNCEFGNLDDEIRDLKDKAGKLEYLAELGTISEQERACWLETRRHWIKKEKNKVKHAKTEGANSVDFGW